MKALVTVTPELGERLQQNTGMASISVLCLCQNSVAVVTLCACCFISVHSDSYKNIRKTKF